MSETEENSQGTHDPGKPTVVLGTIGHDAHVVGIWVLRHALRDGGFNVTYLGALVPPHEFIDAAVETNADAIWISSMYGMARIDCEGFRDKCIEAGLGDIPIYIGGTLVTDPELWEDTRRLFEDEFGFNRAYPPGTSPEEPIRSMGERIVTPGTSANPCFKDAAKSKTRLSISSMPTPCTKLMDSNIPA